MSNDDFLSSGRVMALSCIVIRKCTLVERRVAQIGDSWCEHARKLLDVALTSQVGSGTSEHCFLGVVFSTFTTSSGITGLKCVSGYEPLSA